MKEPIKVQCLGCKHLSYHVIDYVENPEWDSKLPLNVGYCHGCMTVVDTMVDRECRSFETY